MDPTDDPLRLLIILRPHKPELESVDDLFLSDPLRLVSGVGDVGEDTALYVATCP